MDLADAYVKAYDRMTPCAGARCDRMRPDALRVAERVQSAVERSGGMALPANWLSGPAPSVKLFGVLLGLHQVLLDADRERDDLSTQRRKVLRGRLTRTGRLNTKSTKGALVYARTMCGRPDRVRYQLDEFLPVLRRIPENEWKLMQVRHAKAVLDLDASRAKDIPETEPTAPLLIAQLPFLADKDDLDWGPEGEDRYRVAPRTDRLRGHIKAALAELDDSKAHLGILPEASLNDDLLAIWRDVMVNGRRPSGSRLTWILVGTGPVKSVGPPPCVPDIPPNRAVLLHRRTGRELLAQDKQFGFTLDADRQQEYDLRDPSRCDLGGVTRGEWIAEGEKLNILESHSGRYAILICEDVGRLLKTGHTLAVAGVSHVLVPVLAAAMHKKGWSGRAAEELARDAGAAVAVSNGLAIHRYIPAQHCANNPYCPAPTLLAATPARTRPIQSYVSYAPKEIGLPEDLAVVDSRVDALTPRCFLM
ncbi:hypothetical protein [Streptomyces collinus]|uniref:Uncharacterized protein n=1 Tax=Streptomyces collinus TaxID=42684 RepID=A0AA89Q9N3_STRCU|nr:hypothetical protein [Streptomyces collinus]MBB5816922.1 hypothetical protein [Streptomyces collinus]WMX61850.1 hypothetical protein RFN52_00085 [Streptomyces collinus]